MCRCPRFVSLGLLVLASCGGTRDASTPSSCSSAFDEAAVVAVLEGQRDAWNTGDIEGFLAGYEPSERLLFTSATQIRRGFETTARKFKERYGTATETMGTLQFDILDVRGLGHCNDAAVVLGRWRVEGGDSNGSGVFSVILERSQNGWHIVHDHTSATPEAKEGAAPHQDTSS